MKPSSYIGVGLTLAVYLLHCPSAFPQGSLTPPGPPGPTMKTLDQIEPRVIINAANCPGDSTNQFIISGGGSYYLTGKILGVANKNGISIQSDNVTVDLNGFAVNGNVNNSLTGIVLSGFHNNIAIRNGTVVNWGSGGISLIGAKNSQIDHIRASANTNIGISAGLGSTLTHCIAYNNQGTGIYAAQCTLADCAALGTQTQGNFRSVGIDTSESTLTNCAALGNTGIGISADTSALINCTASGNQQTGIEASESTLTNCTASSNIGDGMVVQEDSHVFRNQCDNNQGAGIHAKGDANRIEQNNVTYNNVGIQVDGTVNLVAGNSARGNNGTNGNYFIVAGNRVGDIVIPPLSGAITGNTGAAGMGTSSPWANLAY
jgi:parallel beta-helix repeat protein